MVVSITWKVVRNDFLAKVPLVRNAAGRGTMKSAERVVAAARGRAKVDTGTMRNSTVAVKTGPTSAEAQARAPYSGFLDKGTRYIAADYWFSGAAENEAQSFGPAMAAEIKSALG